MTKEQKVSIIKDRATGEIKDLPILTSNQIEKMTLEELGLKVGLLGEDPCIISLPFAYPLRSPYDIIWLEDTNLKGRKAVITEEN
jgi:hypothetical protein